MQTVLDFTPQPVKLKFYLGQTIQFRIPVLGDDGKPLDLSTAILKMQIKAQPTDDTPVKELTTGQGLTGQSFSRVDGILTVDFPVGVYVYDIWMEIPDNNVAIAKGWATVELNVTR